MLYPTRPTPAPTRASPYVWPGLSPAPSGLFCYPWYDPDLPRHHPCWHDENSHQYTAIDYSYYWPDDCTDEDVWLDYTGDFQLFKMAKQTDYCTGVRAKIYLGSYAEQNYKGDLHYLHIDPNEFWIGQEVPYQLIWIGDVLDEELDPYCEWTDAHLHQSARITAETPFYSNKLADPTHDDNWEHAILWEPGTADSDGDDFVNQDELYIDTDPFDACADTGIWNDEHPDPWPPDFNDDRVVDITDALIFLSAFPSGLGDPNYDARCDMQPNGVIDVFDALIFLGYFPSTCA